ncbi:MAG: cytochrome c oxidase subunit II [Caldithrix sp.]|nr:cytochrome c oxidase subunit II [Caldithrix sp.]
MDKGESFFLPAPSSTVAGEVDALFNFILIASTVLFFIVVFGSIFFAIRYRRRNGKRQYTSEKAHNTKLEIIWTIIPTILVVIVFFWGFSTYLKMHVVPKDALQIKATGQKWFWQFEYKDGASSTNELVVPVGKPVEITLSSTDVIHSFYVPNFRIKMDALPNRYTKTWFEATQEGTFDLFCAEYCGTGHSKMIGTVKVVSEREYDEWLENNAISGEGLSLVELGEKLYTSKACNTCHSIDGTPNTGPTFQGIFGRQEKLQDGTDITADENYIRESILNPQAKIVSGYQPVMPTYQNILKDREVDALVEYLKTLSN